MCDYPSLDEVYHVEDGRTSKSVQHPSGSTDPLHVPLVQTRSSQSCDARDSKRCESGSHQSSPSSQTQDGDRSRQCDSEVHPRPRLSSARVRDSGGYQIALKAAAARQRRSTRAAKLVYRFLHKRTTRSTPAEAKKLKFHMKQMNPIDLAVVLELAKKKCPPQLVSQLLSTMKYVQSSVPYEKACKDKAEYVDNADSNLTADDIQHMKDVTNCEPCPHPKRYAKVWTVTEKEKERRRFILWPKQVNEELEREFGIPSIDITEGVQHMKKVHEDTGAMCFDLEKSYYQIPLAPEVRPYFAFVLDGVVYQPTVVPMGVNFAPALMHNIVKVLSTTLVTGVRTDVYIDNIRFHGSDRDRVEKSAKVFQQHCHDANVTLNIEDLNQWHTLGIWLGCEVDYTQAIMRLAPKTLKKLREERDRTLRNEEATLGDIQVLFGLLFYASRVLRLPTVDFYTAIKYYRRRQSEMLASPEFAPSTTRADIWKCAKPQIEEWLDLALQNNWTNHPSTVKSHWVLATDASITGWGAVLYNMSTGQVLSVGGRWRHRHEAKEINTLEMLAVQKACYAFERELSSPDVKALDLLVDNTATMYTMRKGHSSKFDLNQALRRSLRALPKNIPMRIGYITTADNPADSLSRGRPLESAQGTSSMRGAVERMEGGPDSCLVANPASFQSAL